MICSRDFDAVVMCGGATKPRDLAVEGRRLAGIHFAMEFLTANTKRLLRPRGCGLHLRAGRDVVVIGGGDTGTDCVATALRQGCRSIVQLEIVPRPPGQRQAENPWPQWPKVYKLDYGQEEAAALYGGDPRMYATQTRKFVGDDGGRVREVHTVAVAWRDVAGRPVPQEIGGTERILPAQLVLLAMGFLGPEETVLDQLGIATG